MSEKCERGYVMCHKRGYVICDVDKGWELFYGHSHAHALCQPCIYICVQTLDVFYLVNADVYCFMSMMSLFCHPMYYVLMRRVYMSVCNAEQKGGQVL